MKGLPFGTVAECVVPAGPAVGGAVSDKPHYEVRDPVNQVRQDHTMRLGLLSAWYGLTPTTTVVHLKRDNDVKLTTKKPIQLLNISSTRSMMNFVNYSLKKFYDIEPWP